MALPAQVAPVANPEPTWGQGFKEFFTGTSGRAHQIPRFTSPQHELIGQLSPAIANLLGSAGNGSFNFAPIAKDARTRFNTQTVPSLAERFTALGGQSSSAFKGALGQASHGLEDSLAALEAKYGLAQQGNRNQLLLALLSFALQPQFESIYNPSQPGFLQGLAGGIGGGLGNVGGSLALSALGLL